jgi:hypothetical protein
MVFVFAVGQFGHVVQAAAADDADFDRHSCLQRLFTTEDTKDTKVKTSVSFVSIVSFVLAQRGNH